MKKFEMHVTMVQAFVDFRLALLLMNENDGEGRIKHTELKKEAKNAIESLKMKQTKTFMCHVVK